VFLWIVADSFALLAVFTALFAFMFSPVTSLLDSMILKTLGPTKSDFYGHQRLFGAIGFGISAPFVGLAIDRFNSINIIFYSYAVGMLFTAVLIVLYLKVPKEKNLTLEQSRKQLSFSLAFPQLITNPKMLFFMFTVFVLGMGNAVITNFLFLYLKSMGATKTLLGLTITLTVTMEIPFFFFAKQLLNRLGIRLMFVTALSAYTIRVFAYTQLTNPWWVLPVELMHGVTFSMAWAAGVSYAVQIAPAELLATAQGLWNGVLGGLGPAVGRLIGGFVYDIYGPKILFGSFGGIMIVNLIIFLLTHKSNKSDDQLQTLEQEQLTVNDKEKLLLKDDGGTIVEVALDSITVDTDVKP